MVLTKNTPATRVMLLTTRRPSSKMWGRAVKSQSSSTTWAACRAASARVSGRGPSGRTGWEVRAAYSTRLPA